MDTTSLPNTDKEDLERFRLFDLLDRRYVKKAEIVVIRTVVIGFIGLILSSFGVAIVNSVIGSHPAPITITP